MKPSLARTCAARLRAVAVGLPKVAPRLAAMLEAVAAVLPRLAARLVARLGAAKASGLARLAGRSAVSPELTSARPDELHAKMMPVATSSRAMAKATRGTRPKSLRLFGCDQAWNFGPATSLETWEPHYKQSMLILAEDLWLARG